MESNSVHSVGSRNGSRIAQSPQATGATGASGPSGASGLGSWLDYGTRAVKLLTAARSLQLGVEALLGHTGLRRTSGPLAPALWFTAGVLVGGGAAVALAPASGKELRRRLARWIEGGAAEAEQDAQALADWEGEGGSVRGA